MNKPCNLRKMLSVFTLAAFLSFLVLLPTEGFLDTDVRGNRIPEETFLLLFNAHHGEIKFVVPRLKEPWTLVFDTAEKSFRETETAVKDAYSAAPRSKALLSTKTAAFHRARKKNAPA